MKALARVVAAAVVLAALSILAAGGAHAAPPQVDQPSVDRQPSAQDRHDTTWRCSSGHGAQVDCDAGPLTRSQLSPGPAAQAPAARRSLVLFGTMAGFGLLLALAAGGNWLRRHHQPHEPT